MTWFFWIESFDIRWYTYIVNRVYVIFNQESVSTYWSLYPYCYIYNCCYALLILCIKRVVLTLHIPP